MHRQHIAALAFGFSKVRATEACFGPCGDVEVLKAVPPLSGNPRSEMEFASAQYLHFQPVRVNLVVLSVLSRPRRIFGDRDVL